MLIMGRVNFIARSIKTIHEHELSSFVCICVHHQGLPPSRRMSSSFRWKLEWKQPKKKSPQNYLTKVNLEQLYQHILMNLAFGCTRWLSKISIYMIKCLQWIWTLHTLFSKTISPNATFWVGKVLGIWGLKLKTCIFMSIIRETSTPPHSLQEACGNSKAKLLEVGIALPWDGWHLTLDSQCNLSMRSTHS